MSAIKSMISKFAKFKGSKFAAKKAFSSPLSALAVAGGWYFFNRNKKRSASRQAMSH